MSLQGSGTGLSVTGPPLAADTVARRLRPFAGDLHGRPDCRVSWFGPARYPVGHPGSEAAVQAVCGLMEVNGRDSAKPRRVGIEVASVAAGVLAAQGVLAAEIARRRGRTVVAVHTSALQAGLLLLSHYFVVATCLGDAVPGPPLPAPGPPFRSADGEWFEIETLDADAWKHLWNRLGAGHADLGRGWTVFRWRYERAACSLPLGLHEAAARHSLVELEEACRASGVSLSPLRRYRAVLHEPGAGAGHPDVRSVGDRRPGVAGPASHESVGGSAPAGALPLDGIRVVEATSRIQGPFAGMLLRMLGADVVRVQPPEGDYGRAAQSLHREKETVQLDLGTPGGRADLGELVEGADVFLHNWRPGRAEEWGLGHEDLSRRNARLVYAHASGWGDHAPSEHVLGTDFLVQAYAGLGEGLNPEDEPAVPSRIILGDLLGALVGAEGVLSGLYRREQDGGSWLVETSLLSGAMALQAHVLEAFSDRHEGGRREGRPVWGPLDRPLLTGAGTLAVSIDDDDAFMGACRLCDVDPTGRPRATTEGLVAARLRDGRAGDWEQVLSEAGIPCAVVATDLAAVAADPRLADLFEPIGDGGLIPRSPWSFE